MEINLFALDTYFNARMPVGVAVDIMNEEPSLIFIPAKDENTGRRVVLSFKEIGMILRINGVYDKIKIIKDNFEPGREKEINDVTYETLAKYVLQMLNGAVIAQILYPDIIPLDVHKRDYFRSK